MSSQKAREIADRVEEAIQYHRDSVRGRDRDKPNLYNRERFEDDEKVTIHYYSTGGFWHDCWIRVIVFRDGSIDINHCDDDGTRELARLIRSEI